MVGLFNWNKAVRPDAILLTIARLVLSDSFNSGDSVPWWERGGERGLGGRLE